MSQLRLKLQSKDSSEAFNTRGVFSSGYLLRHLRRESDHLVSAGEAEETHNFARELWADNHVAMRKRGEAFTCSKFIEPLLQRMGWALIPQEAMPANFATRKRPDYCLFLSEEEQRGAAQEDSSQNLFRRSATVFEVKTAEHPLDRVSQRETPGWFPSQQVQDYLRHARDATGRRFFDWVILSNGNQWRLYTEHAAPDAYFEFELASDGELCAIEEFRIFLTLFRPQAFARKEDGRCFLDDVREQSLRFQADLETNLRKRIFDVLEDLANAYADFEGNKIKEDNYTALYGTSLIFLYRLLFILYAESRGLLPVKPSGAGANRRYRDRYSLARLVERLRDKTQFDSKVFTDLYEELLKLFDLINGTHPTQNEECGVTQYNGGLFKPEGHPLIGEWRIADRALADVLRQLIFAQPPARRSQRQQQLSTDEAIDYSTLDVRQLGDIYEGLLGAHLKVDADRLALKNERGENHRQGIYYTPDWIVCYLVRETLSPLLKRTEQTAAVQRALAARSDERKRDNSFAQTVLQLNLVDPAMGSGHFLVRAVEWLAAEIVRHPTTRRMTAQVIAHGERRRSREEIVKAGLVPVAPGMSQEQAEVAYWRRRVVQACIYGVDLNPLAVELTKLSLWLTCIAIDEPLNFLDHHLRSGNSLLFARPDEINRLPFSQEHFPLGNRPAELLAAAIRDTVEIEVEASTEMQVIEEKERLWREVREKLQPFWTVADLWLAVLNGLPLNDLDYQTWAKSLLDPESLAADESQHAKKLMHSLHEKFEEIQRAFSAFHWHFEFPDVFFAENGRPLPDDEAGFDAVLGNPPYISTHTSSEEAWRAALERRSGFLEDLYIHFSELGFQILKRAGRFGFIVSDTFFTLASKLQMRETLQRNTLTHLGQCDPFEATVDAAIFVAEKNEPAADHEILFVQARPRKNEHGDYTKPEKDLPELPSLDAIEWNGDNTSVKSIGGIVRHGTFRSLRLHSMPLRVPLVAHKRAFFEPRLETLALFDRYNAKVKALVAEWWERIEDSKKFVQNIQAIREYHCTLKAGDVTLVGLIAEGGQGMRTADNARFLGYLENTPQAGEIASTSREWIERWSKKIKVKSRFLD